jgi:hypothetical protein
MQHNAVAPNMASRVFFDKKKVGRLARSKRDIRRKQRIFPADSDCSFAPGMLS